MTWTLETKRNFLIIVNFRDCFSIKLFFLHFLLSFYVIRNKKVCQFLSRLKSFCYFAAQTFATCMQVTFRELSHLCFYIDAITWQLISNEWDFFRQSTSMYRYKFPFLRRYWIWNHIHNDSLLFALVRICRINNEKKNVKTISTLESFSYRDFTNTHWAQKKLFFCLRLN